MTDTEFTLFGMGLLIPAAFKQLFLAGFLGLLIGLERERKRKSASLKTFTFICLGSCLFTILSTVAASASGQGFDQSRIAAQVVSGIGFVGGGVIFKTADRVEGITTAAMIWMTAALGMAIGFNRVGVALAAFAAHVCVYFMIILSYKILDRIRGEEYYGEER